MRKWFTVLAAATAAYATACLNDRDSLAYESRRFPGFVETVASRFERNPPKYYEMRIERIEKQGGAKSLNEFDDLAVAYGRIGKEDEAIAVMGDKAKLMKSMGTLATKMDWYRYHANLGTFQVHRWFHEGAEKSKIDEVREGAKNIEKSIELNPDAHFGRERSQLMVMKWLIALKTGESMDPLGDYIASQHSDTRSDLAKEVKGLMGLVVLGAAWESVDVFDALGRLSAPELQSFTRLRVEELQAAGKKSASGGVIASNRYMPVETREYFEELRENADRYQKVRTDFMMSRLEAGKHPDTDNDFWTGYDEVAAVPPRPVRRVNIFTFIQYGMEFFILGFGGAVIVAIGTGLTGRRARRLAGLK